MSNIYGKAFNNCIDEYFLFVFQLFPDNVNVRAAYNGLNNLKKANPSLFVKFWYSYIVARYNEPIQQGDYDFFIIKEYKQDLNNTTTDEKITKKILEGIEKMRKTVIDMDTENKERWIKYMKQLNDISIIYFNNKNK